MFAIYSRTVPTRRSFNNGARSLLIDRSTKNSTRAKNTRQFYPTTAHHRILASVHRDLCNRRDISNGRGAAGLYQGSTDLGFCIGHTFHERLELWLVCHPEIFISHYRYVTWILRGVEQNKFR
jgi:hypothetical protein